MEYNIAAHQATVPRGLLGYSQSISQNFSPRAQAIIEKYDYLDESVREQRAKLSPFDYAHIARVTTKCLHLAGHLQLNDDQTNILVQGGILHDYGKTSAKIAHIFRSGKKYSRLDLAEQAFKEQHVTARMEWMVARGVPLEVIQVVVSHHEPVYRRKGGDRRIADDKSNNQKRRLGQRRKEINPEIQFLANLFSQIDKTDAILNQREYRSGVSPKVCEKYMEKIFPKKVDLRTVRFLIEINELSH